jgi:hypothetical protein
MFEPAKLSQWKIRIDFIVAALTETTNSSTDLSQKPAALAIAKALLKEPT